MKRVRVTKMGIADNPHNQTASNEEYKYGEHNEKSPPIDYWIEGVLAYKIEIGLPISVNRETRNGIKVDGYFLSSCVESFNGQVAITKNSKYLIETL